MLKRILCFFLILILLFFIRARHISKTMIKFSVLLYKQLRNIKTLYLLPYRQLNLYLYLSTTRLTIL